MVTPKVRNAQNEGEGTPIGEARERRSRACDGSRLDPDGGLTSVSGEVSPRDAGGKKEGLRCDIGVHFSRSC